MQTQPVNSCKNRYEALSKNLDEATTPKVKNEVLTVSEVAPNDDYEPFGFQGFNNNNRPMEEMKKWAKDTNELAWKSIFFHIIEIPLKLISYFVSHNDSHESIWSKGFFTAERLVDCLGGRFRNQIYAHENSNKKKDDNIGAEEYLKDNVGDKTSYLITRVNNFIQTDGRFLVPIIGLVNPVTANTLDWLIGGTIDSIRWKRTASNSAFYPGFLQDVANKIFGTWKNKIKGKPGNEDKIKESYWDIIASQLKKHYNNAKTLWEKLSSNNLNQNEKTKTQLNFYKHLDKLTAAFLSFSQWPNMIGDVARPLARSLELTGASRNLFRILSVIDRPFIWANYIFRFYLPEKTLENKQDKGLLNLSNLFKVAIAGDIIDFTSTMFEDKIKESSSWIQHLVESIKIIKSSAFKLFFSGRRITRTSGLIQGSN